MSQYKIEAGTGQHIGNRQEQQDRVALIVSPRAPGYMMAVIADGMGGITGGKLAAEQVITTAKQAFNGFSPQADSVDSLLKSIARDAHTIIKLTAISSDKKPHSTMVALVLTPERNAVWMHVGDSRLYRFDGMRVAECATDYSYADHEMNNIRVNLLGADYTEPRVTLRRYTELKAGDAFLLCTDGLWHYFSDSELATAIASNSPRLASEKLISQVLERAAGTCADNCTLAIIKLAAAPEHLKSPAKKASLRAI